MKEPQASEGKTNKAPRHQKNKNTQGGGVQRVDSIIHQINRYPADKFFEVDSQYVQITLSTLCTSGPSSPEPPLMGRKA